jgi:hypothetical protein
MGRICCHATGPFVGSLPAEELAQLVNPVLKGQLAEQFVRRVLLARVGEPAQLVNPVVKPQPACPPQPGDVISRIADRADHLDRLVCLTALGKPVGQLPPGMIVALVGVPSQLVDAVIPASE